MTSRGFLWRRRVALAASSCFVVAGAGHLALMAASGPATGAAAATAEAMRGTEFALGVPVRSMWQLYLGLSVATGILLVGVGVLAVLAYRTAARPPTHLLVAHALLSVALFGVAVTLLPLPPIVLLGVASVLFVSCLVASAIHPTQRARPVAGSGSAVAG